MSKYKPHLYRTRAGWGWRYEENTFPPHERHLRNCEQVRAFVRGIRERGDRGWYENAGKPNE